ncbi:hypothetical protein SCUP234_09417 [Seiridium cupressi]
MVDDDHGDGAHSFNGYDLASSMNEPKTFALIIFEFSDKDNCKCSLRLNKKTGGLVSPDESEVDESEKGEWENDEVRKKVRKAVTRWVPKSKVEKEASIKAGSDDGKQQELQWLPQRLIDLAIAGAKSLNTTPTSSRLLGFRLIFENFPRKFYLVHSWKPARLQEPQVKDTSGLTLCIVQDSQEDWKDQSGQAWEVYSNSYLNISATASANPEEGLPRQRPEYAFAACLTISPMATLNLPPLSIEFTRSQDGPKL